MDRLRISGRWIALTLVVVFAGVVVVAPVAGAHTLSKGAALRKTSSVARSVALSEGASYYLAGGCKRLSRHAVRCIGAVLESKDYGCAQRVRVSFVGQTRRLRAVRYGGVVCGDPSEDESVGGGGSSPAICAIRQSVCI